MIARLAQVLVRGRIWLIAAVLLTVPLVIHGARSALATRDNDVRQWLPDGFQETQRYDWFLQHFGSEEFALISWDGASITDQRVAELAARLREHVAATPAVDAEPLWFREILTGTELLQQLQAEPLSLSESEAVARLRGSLLGPDGRTTGLLARLSLTGQADRHSAVATIYQEALNAGVAAEHLRLGGPTIDSVALDQESERSRYLLTALSLVLGTLAAWRCLRRFSLVAVVLLTSMYCAATSLAWVSVFGDQLNMIMVTMPTMVYVLTISSAIHVTHYFHSAVREHGHESALKHALAAGWLPCLLTALTTAFGLGSLMVSHVTPIRLFGMYSALSVIAGLPIVLFFLPAVLSLLPHNRTETQAKTRRHREPLGTQLFQRIGDTVIRHHRAVSVAGLGLMLVSVVGLARLETSVKLIDFFSPRSRVIADYTWLENNLGPLVPVEVVLRVPAEDNSRMVGRVELAGKVQQALTDLPYVDGAMSAATFAPATPPESGFMKLARQVAVNKQLEQSRDQLVDAGYLAQEGQTELWRVSARVAALNDVDYGQFIERIKAAVQPVLDDYSADSEVATATVQAEYTGVVPLIYKAQRVLLEDLMASFVTAFISIGFVMLFLMRGWKAGLVSMLPNVFPAVVVFGAMGWIGRNCDVGAMITASVAMGIAVDDTIHFLSWFRRGLNAGLSRHDAIRHAYDRCATAMLQTTLICGLGMLGFAFSSFAPTAGFATLMMTLLLAALAGDLLLLPALMAGPLGRLFEPAVETVETEAVTPQFALDAASAV